MSGIGPKVALAVLSGIEPGELIKAIQRGDLARLTAIPGVGKKTSERIVLELKDRLPQAAHTPAPRGRRRGAVRAEGRRAVRADESGLPSPARRKGRRCGDQDEQPATSSRRCGRLCANWPGSRWTIDSSRPRRSTKTPSTRRGFVRAR